MAELLWRQLFGTPLEMQLSHYGGVVMYETPREEQRVAMVPEQTSATNIIDRLRQAYCGLQGHDSLLQFQRDRMFLKCTSCGHESPGWEMNETPPTVTETQPVRQPRLVGAQFVGERRVA